MAETGKKPVVGGPVGSVGPLRVVILVYECFRRNALMATGAGLGFLSALAAVPVITVGFILLDAIGAHPTLQAGLKRSLPPEFERQIDTLFNQTLGTAGTLLGILLLAVIGFWILISLERTLNAMWGIRRPRRFVNRLQTYMTVFFLGSLGLTISLGVTPFFFRGDLGLWLQTKASFLDGTVLTVAPFVTSSAMLFLVFVFLPNTAIPLRAALVGGIVGGCLWEGLKLPWLNITSFTLSSFPSWTAFLTIPVTLLWIYFSWTIAILMGAALTYAVQHVKTHRRELDLPIASQALKERLALRIVLQTSRLFIAGGAAPTVEELSAALNMPLRLVSQVTYQLIMGGVLQEQARTEKRAGGIAPAREPQQITVRNVLESLRSYGIVEARFPGDRQGEEIEGMLENTWDKMGRALAKVNFRDLAVSDVGEISETAPQRRS